LMVRGPRPAGGSLAADLPRADADLRGVAEGAGPAVAAGERAPAAERRDADEVGCLLDTGSFLAERARDAQMTRTILGSGAHARQPWFTLCRPGQSPLRPAFSARGTTGLAGG
jgi:hypothetical protein